MLHQQKGQINYANILSGLNGWKKKKALMSDIKDIFSEAKASGFDPKTMRQIIRIRAMDEEVLAEQETLLDTYRDALGLR